MSGIIEHVRKPYMLFTKETDMFKSYVCTCCGIMFTFPDSFEVPRVKGEPAHMSCHLKYVVRQKAISDRIEYLTTLRPKTAEEEESIHDELMQLIGKE